MHCDRSSIVLKLNQYSLNVIKSNHEALVDSRIFIFSLLCCS